MSTFFERYDIVAGLEASFAEVSVIVTAGMSQSEAIALAVETALPRAASIINAGPGAKLTVSQVRYGGPVYHKAQ